MEKMNLKINVPEVDKNEFVYTGLREIFSDEAVVKVMISWFHEVYESLDLELSEKQKAEVQKHEEMLSRFLASNEDNKPVMDYYYENINK